MRELWSLFSLFAGRLGRGGCEVSLSTENNKQTNKKTTQNGMNPLQSTHSFLPSFLLRLILIIPYEQTKKNHV